MRVWLVTVGEPLPLGDDVRLLRTGQLAAVLRRRGHEVTWWTSRFDHYHKAYFTSAGEDTLADGTRMMFLAGRPYTRNVSLARLANHQEINRDFRRRIPGEVLPDVICCSFPTIELSLSSVRFARSHDRPIALDVRDLWPDIFLQAVPAPLRPLGRLALAPLAGSTRKAFRGATAVLGTSEGYLDWGLRQAGRLRQRFDTVVPLAYERRTYGADVLEGAGRSLRACGVDPARPLVCFVGSFGRTYDLGPAIAAARALADTPYQFVLSGTGERNDEWRSAALGAPNVIFTGWLSASEIGWMLHHASVGLAAYAADAPQGLPNKYFEYLAAGLPIVSSLRGEGEAFLAEHGCGVSYDALDASTLASALRRMLGDPDARARMAASSRRLFDARFASEVVNARFAEYLERLAADGSAVSGRGQPAPAGSDGTSRQAR